MKTLEEIYEDYKTKYEFRYIDHDGTAKYSYCGKIDLSLDEIHKCELDYMTKACVIPDGHMIKELTRIFPLWVIVEEKDKYMKIQTGDYILEGYKCLDPYGKSCLYCI